MKLRFTQDFAPMLTVTWQLTYPFMQLSQC